MNEPQPHDGTNGTGPKLNRRQFIKAGAAAGGVAAVGSGMAPHPDRLSPVGDASALCGGGWCVLGAVAIGSAGVGFGANEFLFNDDVDEDEIQGDIEDRNWNRAGLLKEGRGPFEDLIQPEFNPSNQSNSMFADSVWSMVRTTTVESYEADKSKTYAKSEARRKLDVRFTRAALDYIKAHNNLINKMTPVIVDELENDRGQLYWDDNDYTYEPAGSVGDWTGDDYRPWTVSGQTVGVVAETSSFSWPADPQETDELGEKYQGIEGFIPMVSKGGSGDPSAVYPWGDLVHPDPEIFSRPSGTGWVSGAYLTVSHPDSKKSSVDNVIAGITLSRYFSTLVGNYTTIYQEIGTYVDSMYADYNAGRVDPSRSISPTDLREEFANSSDQKRVIDEIAAQGGSFPKGENLGTRAKISHPDLLKNEQWGWLYPRSDENLTLKAGGTISSSQYSSAYFLYRDENGEIVPAILNGEYDDIQILDLETDGSVEVEPTEQHNAAGENGRVTLWDSGIDGEAPPPIKYPKDHQNWAIVVDGANTSYQTNPPDIQSQSTDGGTEYYLPTTDLASGELVNSINVIRPMDYSAPVEGVVDPSNPDPEKQAQRYEDLYDFYDRVREANGGPGPIVGGGGFFDGLPSLPGLGVIESAVVVIVGAAALNAASG